MGHGMVALEGFEPVDRAEAARLLEAEAGMAGEDLDAIAAALEGEPPVLRWAASLARTMGWKALHARLGDWALFTGLVRGAVPWREEVLRVGGALEAAERTLLATLAACDAPFTWEVLERAAPDASVEGIVALEEVKLLRRTTRHGVVMFAVPFAVRAALRLADPDSARRAEAAWLGAWSKRIEELRPATYGASARAALFELGAAATLADRALGEATLSLWLAASDAWFFGDGADFASPSFERAVALADATGDPDARIRTRLVAARARLERGADAMPLIDEAARLDSARDDVRRGEGWAAVAMADVDRARRAFTAARELAETARDPRGQADASAGLGIVALLGGEHDRARAHLAEALAIHVVMRDAPREATVRGMMELLPERREEASVSELAAQAEAFRANGQRWREALALARLGLAARGRGDAESETTHLLEARAAASLANVPARELVSAMLEAAPLVVGPEGRSLTLPTGETHDLVRHGPLRRVLWALALAKRDRPGVAMSTLDLVAAGWPGEKMKHSAATLRVYTTIRRLRALGLGEALITTDDGYLLDPRLRLAV